MPDEQQPMFATVPAVSPLRVEWTCTKCGNDDQRQVRAVETRPSLDERYALGHCDECTPARKTVRGLAREIVPLVRSGHWDRTTFLERQRQAADAKLLARYRRGHALTPEELAQVKTLVDRMGGAR